MTDGSLRKTTASDTTRAVLLGVFTLASCVSVGGYVAIAVVAPVARRTLEPGQRVAFFRGLGHSYLLVGAPALAIALGTGSGLVRSHAWGGVLVATIADAAILLVALAVGVAQARRMTRAAIGLLSLALIALGSLLAT